MEKLKAGMKFNEVAATFSEDKARSGVSYKQFFDQNSYYIIYIKSLLSRVTWAG